MTNEQLNEIAELRKQIDLIKSETKREIEETNEAILYLQKLLKKNPDSSKTLKQINKYKKEKKELRQNKNKKTKEFEDQIRSIEQYIEPLKEPKQSDIKKMLKKIDKIKSDIYNIEHDFRALCHTSVKKGKGHGPAQMGKIIGLSKQSVQQWIEGIDNWRLEKILEKIEMYYKHFEKGDE